jgi:hypothetical protein
LIERAIVYNNCDEQREFEISAHEGDIYFKINFLENGERCSFWYNNNGSSYIPSSFQVKIEYYTNNFLRASFSGGVVHEGSINLKIAEG